MSDVLLLTSDVYTYRTRFKDDPQSRGRWRLFDLVTATVYPDILQEHREPIRTPLFQYPKVHFRGEQLEPSHALNTHLADGVTAHH